MRPSSRIYLATAVLVELAATQFGNQTIDPDSVSLSTRNSWCLTETRVCDVLCGSKFSPNGNSCDASKLQYLCLCLANGFPSGLIPGNFPSYYGSLPAFICREYVSQCVAANQHDPQKQLDCKNYNKCGTLNATVAETQADGADPSGRSSSSTITSTSSPSTSVKIQTLDTEPSSTSSVPKLPTLIPSASNTAAAASSSIGLSNEAKIGIGVGVPVGALILAGLGWFLYRLGSKKATREPPLYEKPELDSSPVKPTPLPTEVVRSQPYPYELEAGSGRQEVEGDAHHRIAPAAELHNRVTVPRA